jgi:hypothetical protein
MADVAPGDVIDKTNYQKIEGLVPDFVLDWVKNGDLTMKIGQLAFDPKTFWSKEILDNWKSNLERYTVDEHNGIIDKTTGKPARGIKGFPFPEVDPADPMLPVKVLWNRQFMEYFLQGDMHERQYWLSVTRGGLEKSYVMENLSLIYDPTKSEYDYAQLSVFREPFNMAGTGSLAIYALYPLQDGIRYAYAPELRRLKRLSHRLAGSDVMFGLDQAPDDSWAGGPKSSMEEGAYRYIGERDALVCYTAEKPIEVDWNAKGGLDVGPAETGVIYNIGFETPGWTGAAWHMTNVIWVKSRVYVFESKSTDPNYAYGPCEGWIEQGTFANAYKRITDPNGKLWKGQYWITHAQGSKDAKFRVVDNFATVIVDLRRDHGSSFPYAYRRGGFKHMMIQDQNENLFTSGGFIKFTK